MNSEEIIHWSPECWPEPFRKIITKKTEVIIRVFFIRLFLYACFISVDYGKITVIKILILKEQSSLFISGLRNKTFVGKPGQQKASKENSHSSNYYCEVAVKGTFKFNKLPAGEI